ncbi:MAG: RICIN domain-containing protein, partial [Luteolibacter sp.]
LIPRSRCECGYLFFICVIRVTARVTPFNVGSRNRRSAALFNNGSNLNLWDWVSANNQKWVINPIGDGCFKLVAVHSGKVADVAGPSTADGAAVHQWDYVGALNQQWSFSIAP